MMFIQCCLTVDPSSVTMDQPQNNIVCFWRARENVFFFNTIHSILVHRTFHRHGGDTVWGCHFNPAQIVDCMHNIHSKKKNKQHKNEYL